MNNQETETKASAASRVTKKKSNGASVFFLIIAILAAGAAGYFYWQYSNLKKNPQDVALQENRALIQKVSRLIALPEGEDPTIATVADPEQLKSQPFFARAKVGDKVLIYANARKAILYDQENNKILEVAPLVIGASTQADGAESTDTGEEQETNQ